MRTITTIAAASLLAAAAASASAQVYYSRPYTYDPYWVARNLDSNTECWNPGARHFERVRPGEVQNDLDFNRCRTIGDRWGEYRDYRDYRDYRYSGQQECWNPRAGHYEAVRPGEYQGDLDFGRCRIYR
jgi:hypothetical protein